ncbi:hypothetical protein B1222_11650 [Paenibacillus larvae subsp. pulvifaciens]|nr:hypothetical protein B1222_11650 [Paenibacillus larvae subsp. pulvifaciens]AQZ46888.1 hypothetical protein B5S25_10085 [Paenibacillus larvae subsp. pulvifaciens]MBH0343074.1 hypothetical protein [Paenibacillus larvae]
MNSPESKPLYFFNSNLGVKIKPKYKELSYLEQWKMKEGDVCWLLRLIVTFSLFLSTNGWWFFDMN